MVWKTATGAGNPGGIESAFDGRHNYFFKK